MLEVSNLTKKYKVKHGEEVLALNGVSLSFAENGMVFIVGKSGSGKSTLLHLIGGLDMPDGGEIIVDGKSSKDFKESDWNDYRSRYVGFVFQEYNLLSDFTVRDNLAIVDEIQSKKTDEKRLNELLKSVDLSDMAKRKPKQLSGGQKQRVAIARALLKAPKLILADEPTGALDEKTGNAILTLLQGLSKDRLVVVVSHDMDFAQKYADRIIEIADGEIIKDTAS